MEVNLFCTGEAKLHGEMCRKLSAVVCGVLRVFPELEAARPRSKSGIQALCALHVALERAKNLVQHCSDCSKLYLAITGDPILTKFEKAKYNLQECLRRVEDIVPQAIGCQIMEIVGELEGTIFALDQSEKEAGDEVIALLQKDKNSDSNINDGGELVAFHQAAAKLGITSARAALTERRALKKLIERARSDEDKRKEFIVSYLLHVLRKYSKIFRNEMADDTDSQGSTPRSQTVDGVAFLEENHGPGLHHLDFERRSPKYVSLNFKQSGERSGNIPSPPEELRCPISLQLMYDPVIISSGQTYERICIEKWFNDGHSTCPKTQQQLDHLCSTPNYCVKGLIASWCEQNGVPIPVGPPETRDSNYWRLLSSDSDVVDSRSIGSTDAWKPKGSKLHSSDESCVTKDLKVNQSDDRSEVDDFTRCDTLLGLLYEGHGLRIKWKIVEKIRLLLKDDEETRIYMGANGFVEALVNFLGAAIDEGDSRAQEVGAMALFNLAVNNNRNKGQLLSAGVTSLLEQMILNPNTQEPAAALYLNLSCLDEAKPVIGSSQAVPSLVELLRDGGASAKHDALYTLYNLSTHPPNIASLLESGIIGSLHSLLISTRDPSGKAWADKALAVLINIASDHAGKRAIASARGLIGSLAELLDTGERVEQEQAVSCLLVLCNGDEACSQMVLQEGVIPSLVSISATGTPRGVEKAQKLLRLFREQRQHEDPPPTPPPHEQQQQTEGGIDIYSATTTTTTTTAAAKPLHKSRSMKLTRSLSSIWNIRSCITFQSIAKPV